MNGMGAGVKGVGLGGELMKEAFLPLEGREWYIKINIK